MYIDCIYMFLVSGCAPLYRAILSNAATIVQLLIHAGADINLRIIGLDVGAETPLIKYVSKATTDLKEFTKIKAMNLKKYIF